jgi:hypothetical protein
MLMYEAPDSVHLVCCNQSGPIQGPVALATAVTGLFGDAIDEETMGNAYIDVSGTVVEYRMRAGPNDGRPSDGSDPGGPDELQVMEHAADGAATQTIHPVALKFLTAPVADGRAWYGDDLRAAQRLTDRYLSAWSAQDGRALGSLYAANATLLDSLLGVRLTGRDAIGPYAAEHGGARLRQYFIGDGPALYGYWRGYQSHLTAYVTYVGEDGNRCPGGVTAELQIEQGQIVAERRYHDVAAMRRCIDDADLPDGWWTQAVIPGPIQDRVTGTVVVADQRIAVHNGTTGAIELVRWAMARFLAADLTAPTVASVAFSEEAHQAQCSADDRGLALKVGPAYQIYLCFTVDGTAPASARELMLHELAHVWMWQNLNAQLHAEFVARLQLPTWDAFDVRWDQRGIEHAAAVIAWGLGGQPQSRLLGSRSCADLAEAFELLTGTTPQQPPCSPGE